MRIFIQTKIFLQLVYDGPSDKHAEWVKSTTKGGVQATIIAVPLVEAYEQAFHSIKRGGRLVAVGLPSGNMSLSILDCVLNGIEIVGSIVGTRQDLEETLQLAKLHQIKCKIQKRKLEEINEIFDQMNKYQISGRVVLDFTGQ